MSEESLFNSILKWVGWKADQKEPRAEVEKAPEETEGSSSPPKKAIPGSELYKSSDWGRDQEGGWREPESRFMEFLDKYGDEIGPDVLDVGCGVGRHILPLVERGLNVTGLDSSASMLETAAQRTEDYSDKVTLQEGNHQQLDYTDESFDTVVSIQTFQFNDAERSFFEAARVLKPDGLFFLRVRSTTRIDRHPERRIELLSTNEHGGQELKVHHPRGTTHYHHFALQELEHLAELAGLEIVGEPVDERRILKDGSTEPGQWNIVFRKKRK